MFENLNNQGLMKITQNATGLLSASVATHQTGLSFSSLHL